MHSPAMAVVLGVTLLGCGRIGPGTSELQDRGPPGRPCAESIEARAAGRFEELAAKVNPYNTYHRSCEVACNLKRDAAACAEAASLTARYRAYQVYEAPVVVGTVPSGPGVTSTGAMESAANAAINVASSDGFNLGYDELLSLDRGVVTFEIQTQPSLDYLIILIGDTTTTFTAEATAVATEGSWTFQRQSVAGVFVLMLSIKAPGGQNMWIRISDDGGDRGAVRALRFEKWR